MKLTIDFEECLKDSPLFRANLELAETDIDVLEIKLNKVIRNCGSMIECGRSYGQANKLFVASITELSHYFEDDALVSPALEKFSHDLLELQKFHEILLEQAQRTICKNLRQYVNNDIQKVKESKKIFEKLSDELDTALTKSCQASKLRLQECDDADRYLQAMRTCFSHTALDHVFQVNVLHSTKRFDVLETMMSFMRAYSTYAHQTDDLFEDVDPHLKHLSLSLDQLRSQAKDEKKEMEERHDLVQQRENSINNKLTHRQMESGGFQMEGYLVKRTSNAFKSWVRRWFIIQNNQLVYRKRCKDELSVMEEDLRLCMVRKLEDVDRRFCFEILSPTKHHTLQAESESLCQQWITGMETSIAKAYGDREPESPPVRSSVASPLVATTSTHTTHRDSATITTAYTTISTSTSTASSNQSTPEFGHTATEIPKPKPSHKQSFRNQLLKIPGNNKCCDCGAADPMWASINLGITLCIECCGIHRSLGVHVSKVRSICLDAWEPEQIKVMAELGNTIINSIYEAEAGSCGLSKPPADARQDVRQAWIKNKYVCKKFVRQFPTSSTSHETVVRNRKSVRRWSVKMYRRKTRPASVSSTEPEGAGVRGEVVVGAEFQEETCSAVDVPLPETQGGAMAADSTDSGLGDSNTDVVVFGAGVPSHMSTDLVESSDESLTEVEPAACATVGCEDWNKLNPDLLLYKAALARNLPVMAEALAHQAHSTWVNADDGGNTALHQAVLSASVSTVEFLLLNGSPINVQNVAGRTPLHLAVHLQHTGQVCLLLKRYANQHVLDADGNSALSLALNTTNADIVTLIRLAKLNEEMKEADFTNPSDETFNEVFRDFSNLANSEPEKLHRTESDIGGDDT